MTIAAVALLTPSAILLCDAALTCIRSSRALSRQLWAGAARFDRTTAPFVFVLLPMHNEQSIVSDTLEHFLALDYPRDRLGIVVVTGDAEHESRRASRARVPSIAARIWQAGVFAPDQISGALPLYLGDEVERRLTESRDLTDFSDRLLRLHDDHPTTQALAADWLANHPGAPVLLMHEPSSSSSKASKLNYALCRLHEEGEDLRSSYLGVFDADSRPDLRTLGAVASALQSATRRPFAIQQLPLAVLEPKFWRPSRLRRILMTVGALTLMRRSLSIELWHHQSSHRRRLFLQYFMGASVFLDPGPLLRSGGFPAYCDDIPLGYRADLLGLEVSSLPVFNYVTINRNVGEQFAQFRHVCLGVCRGLYDEYRASRRSTSPHPVRRWDVGRVAYTIVYDHAAPLLAAAQAFALVLAVALSLAAGKLTPAYAALMLALLYVAAGVPILLNSRLLSRLRVTHPPGLDVGRIVRTPLLAALAFAPAGGVVKGLLIAYGTGVNLLAGWVWKDLAARKSAR
jgi:hypothetical protein